MQNKVEIIIDEECDGFWTELVMVTLLEIFGMNNAAFISDEYIENVQGSEILSLECHQSVLRAARRIAKECRLLDDVIPYIAKDWPDDSWVVD